MQITQPIPWTQTLFEHIQEHPYSVSGLGLALVLVLFLLLQSILHITNSDSLLYVQYALIGGGAGFLATSLGALPAFFLKHISQSVEDSMLGFAAGMMLAATAFSLLMPGLEAGAEITNNKLQGGLIVVLGMVMGMLLMLGLDRFTPHEHDKTGPCGPGHAGCNRAWLFVFAIALHNVPEGMAVGVSLSQGDMSTGIPMTVAIALQNIPEGLAVALTLRAVGVSPLMAVSIAGGTGLLEPFGSLLGAGLGGGSMLFYPVGLGLAAGAMLFVISHEVIPETHRNGHQTVATLGLMGGFVLMMLLDAAL